MPGDVSTFGGTYAGGGRWFPEKWWPAMESCPVRTPARDARSPRRGRLLTVVGVLVLGLVGLGAAPAGATARPATAPGTSATTSAPASAPGADAAAAASGGLFTSLRPSRLLDTRSGLGAPAAKVGPGGTVHLQVGGRGGVPSSGVAAVLLNVTVTEPTRYGHVTVYGDGTALPDASNLNFRAGRTVPNLVVTPVGSNGKVALYNGSAGSTHLVADVEGYYLSGAATEPGSFQSVTPARVLDTRSGVGAPLARLEPGGTVHLQVGGVAAVPASGVSAVVLNVTVVAPTATGHITVHADGSAVPATSNLNFDPGQTVPNLVVAQVDANGRVALENGSPGTLDLVADVFGYVLSGTPAQPGALTSLAPKRVLDTRSGTGAAQAKVGPGATVHLQVGGRGGVPKTGVSAVVLNVTVTGPTRGGYITAYADGTGRPKASNLNFVRAQTVANLVVVPVAPNGKVALYNGSTGSTSLLADVAGYFIAPATTGAVCTNPYFTTSNTNGGITDGAYYVHNNLWNVGGYPGTKGTTSVCSYHSWNHVATASNSSGDGAVKTYPNVHKDYDTARKISSFTTLTSKFSAISPQVGIYNVAYDLWVNGYNDEIMIWTENHGQTPAGNKVASAVSLGGYTWDVYAESGNGYIAFVPSGGAKHTSGTIDLKAILNYLVSKGRRSASDGIDQICYGVEIVSTGGTPANWYFTDFSITDS
jgi:hypothetical protein